MSIWVAVLKLIMWDPSMCSMEGQGYHLTREQIIWECSLLHKLPDRMVHVVSNRKVHYRVLDSSPVIAFLSQFKIRLRLGFLSYSSIQALDFGFVSISHRHHTFYLSCLSCCFFINLQIDLVGEENELCTGWAKNPCAPVGSRILVRVAVTVNVQNLRLQCVGSNSHWHAKEVRDAT
jgi:hypothetical protein